MTEHKLQYDPNEVAQFIEAFSEAESDEERETITEQLLQVTVGKQADVDFYLTLISKAGLKQLDSPSNGFTDAKERVVRQLADHQEEASLRVRHEMVNRIW